MWITTRAGFGAAMFGIQGAAEVWDLEFGLPVAPVILGIITAIGGGPIRDALADRATLLIRRELYAVPVCVGCIAFGAVLRELRRASCIRAQEEEAETIFQGRGLDGSRLTGRFRFGALTKTRGPEPRKE